MPNSHNTHSDTNGRLASQPSGGPAVDKQGDAVVDPTRNVLDLVGAAIRRQDDLRDVGEKHVRELSALRADYDEKLREAETSRIDAIRQVDVGNVQRAAEVQAAQALTLASQVTTSADALRGQVEAARQQTATTLAAALEPIQKDIQDLRRVQYEGVGSKTQVVESQATAGVSGMWVGIAIGAAGFLLSIVVVILAR